MREVTPGGRIPLDAVYRNADDELVDPVTPLVDILDPANTVVANDIVPVRSSLGLYDYPAGGYLVPADAPLGVWTARWTGTVAGDLLEALDEFEVVASISGVPDGALATVAELETLLQRTFSGPESAAAEQILTGVSASIRSYCRQVLSRVDDDSIRIDREGHRRTLWLPELPVIGVASITIDGGLVPSASYRVNSETGEVRFSSPIGTWGASTSFEPQVTVIYSHGFDPMRADIRDIALEMASGGVEVPSAGVEVEESLGTYSVKFDVERARVLNDSQRARLAPYRTVVVA